MDLTIKQKANNANWTVMDFEKKMMKKENKCATKRKTQFKNLCTTLWNFAVGSITLLLIFLMHAFTFWSIAFLFIFPKFLTYLLTYPALVFYSRSLTLLFSCVKSLISLLLYSVHVAIAEFFFCRLVLCIL